MCGRFPIGSAYVIVILRRIVYNKSNIRQHSIGVFFLSGTPLSSTHDPDLHHRLMRAALDQARLARDAGEVPIGCVVFHHPTAEIIGTGYNLRETTEDPTAHAEVVAIRQAAQKLGTWRLIDCTIVVTLEPCCMCAGAIVNARILRVVYGCDDPKGGAVKTLYQLCDDARLNHRAEVVGGVLADECAELLRDFFKAQRALGKK
jgi:tRNA(adenine34) deaminase